MFKPVVIEFNKHVDAESKDVLLSFTEFPNWAKRNKHYAGNSNDKINGEAKY